MSPGVSVDGDRGTGSTPKAAIVRERRGLARHPITDGLSERLAPSDTARGRLLAHDRKYGHFRILAHRRWGQVTVGVQGALRN